MSETKSFQLEINGHFLQIDLKNWAEQASGSCVARLGDTEILVTAVMSKNNLENSDFFPLTVDYEERYYAAGKIFGSRFIKRESRPTDEAILTGRMIDRAIRPRFPKNFKRETQVIATCLSWDRENDPDIPALIAASTALSISDIPFEGPVGAVRVGRIDNNWVFNPTYEEREKSEIDLVLAGVEIKGEILINMVEMGGKEVAEKDVAAATQAAEPIIKKIIDFQKEIIKIAGKEKIVLPLVDDDKVKKQVKEFCKNKLEKAIFEMEPQEKDLTVVNNLREELEGLLAEKYDDPTKIKLGLSYFEEEVKEAIYKNIIENNKRPDGRKTDEVRKIFCEVGVLPRTHGSALFSRGKTRILSILTLGGPKDQQLLEGMEFIGKKRFMHHYNFPPYSSGEVNTLRGPKRREIGHGCLVEKAILPLIPDYDQFPYTIRVVSESLSSNGSTSMASVCATSLALFDAGVPIKEAVAGISIGLAEHQDRTKQKLLVDIQGPEDHLGGMDFKIAGTKNGITAIQMDTKTDGISINTMEEAMDLAKKDRLEILEIMNKTMSKPREIISPLAPKIKTIQINPEKIGELVGPRGSVINKIIEEYKVSIDIEESGRVFVTGENEESVENTIKKIKNITREIEVGETFQGEVKRISDFGAFVEILPGLEGLVHISKIVPYHLRNIQEIMRVGDKIPVKVISIDEQGRINLSAIDAGFRPQNQPDHKPPKKVFFRK